MNRPLNGNWKTAVVIVIGVLLTTVGWMVQQGYASLIKRLETIEVQTRPLPALQAEVARNTRDIEVLKISRVGERKNQP